MEHIAGKETNVTEKSPEYELIFMSVLLFFVVNIHDGVRIGSASTLVSWMPTAIPQIRIANFVYVKTPQK